jgi:hypothetical protein
MILVTGATGTVGTEVLTQRPDDHLEKVLRFLLVLLVAGAAFSELLGAEPVVRSLQTLGYPMYLMPVLGVTKLLAVVALLAPVPRWVREWAYAGLAFDFALATVSFLFVGQALLPDVALAPGYLVLTLVSATRRRRKPSLPVGE